MRLRNLLLLGILLPLLLLAALALNAWRQPPLPKPPTSIPYYADKDLHFDPRYYDSLDNPRTERAKRERAILHQLSRQKMARPLVSYYGFRHDTTGDYYSHDTVYEHVGGGPLVRWKSQAAQRQDINRKIDSLKILEHLPLTPHAW